MQAFIGTQEAKIGKLKMQGHEIRSIDTQLHHEIRVRHTRMLDEVADDAVTISRYYIKEDKRSITDYISRRFREGTQVALDAVNMADEGWHASLQPAGLGEGSSSSSITDSMAETAAIPQSPIYMCKRRRLSRLLDKLAVQIRNNNNYSPPHWLKLDPPCSETKSSEDVPLDLSLKSETLKAIQERHTSEYTCNTCGQTFAVHDRLAKHVASRHRDKAADVVRAYECEICRRRFARSDMLTRHARLHSGVKPYSCSACGQVFSRSDHLATHQRTHTGEKPYRCPTCPYAACRRDMITRHMRTHTRRPTPTEI